MDFETKAMADIYCQSCFWNATVGVEDTTKTVESHLYERVSWENIPDKDWPNRKHIVAVSLMTTYQRVDADEVSHV